MPFNKYWKPTSSNTKTTCANVFQSNLWGGFNGELNTNQKAQNTKQNHWENQWKLSRRKVRWNACHFGSNLTGFFYSPLFQLRAKMATKARWFLASSYWPIRGARAWSLSTFNNRFFQSCFSLLGGSCLAEIWVFSLYLFLIPFL